MSGPSRSERLTSTLLTAATAALGGTAGFLVLGLLDTTFDVPTVAGVLFLLVVAGAVAGPLRPLRREAPAAPVHAAPVRPELVAPDHRERVEPVVPPAPPREHVAVAAEPVGTAVVAPTAHETGGSHEAVAVPVRGGAWWEQAGAARSRPPAVLSLPPAPAPSLDGYRPVARVPQCPRCGGMDIELSRVRGGFSFACPCGREWSWRPGEPWPRTSVGPPRTTAAPTTSRHRNQEP